jgi:hypothetical protein
MVRFGLCYTPVDNPVIRTNLLLETDKFLIFSYPLAYELQDISKTLAAEITLARVVTFRLGWLDDPGWGRGGVVLSNSNASYIIYREGLWNVITGQAEGSFRWLNLCYGIGLSYHDQIRLDFSTDYAPFEDWHSSLRASLIISDLGNLLRKPRGLENWE